MYKDTAYVGLFLLCFASSVYAKQQPLIINNKYYYSATDTHEHINLKKALSFLARKMFTPSYIKKTYAALFSKDPVVAAKLNVQDVMQSMQSVPPAITDVPSLTWIGHASFLLQVNGFNIVTDPLFGDVKAGPFVVSKRALAPGIKLENMPRIDAIVISHNHSDHTDTESLMALAKQSDPIAYVPQGDKALFESMVFPALSNACGGMNTQLIEMGAY